MASTEEMEPDSPQQLEGKEKMIDDNEEWEEIDSKESITSGDMYLPPRVVQNVTLQLSEVSILPPSPYNFVICYQ